MTNKIVCLKNEERVYHKMELIDCSHNKSTGSNDVAIYEINF
jgi:hypothetical protein